MIWYIWVIIGIILIVLEIFTPGFFVMLAGVAAILTGITALFTNSLAVQITTFAILVVVFLVFVRPLLFKYFFKKDKGNDTNARGMIGKSVIVTQEIDNLKGAGYIKYYGDEMPARSVKGETIPAGETVIIKKLEGIKVFVIKRDDDEAIEDGS